MHSFTREEESISPQRETQGELELGFANRLRRLGLAGIAAALLESGGAFATLAAQSLHVDTPVLSTFIHKDQLSKIATMLEDPTQSAEFARRLREPAP